MDNLETHATLGNYTERRLTPHRKLKKTQRINKGNEQTGLHQQIVSETRCSQSRRVNSFCFLSVIGGEIFRVRVRVVVIINNATFNNISVISSRSVLLVKETGGPGVSHRSVVSH